MNGAAWPARCLVALSLTAALAAAAQPGAPCRHPRTGEVVPLNLNESFRLKSTHGFEAEHPGYGCSIRFEHDSGLWVDVYIFRAGLGEIEDRERDPRLMQEFQEAMQGILQKWKELESAEVSELKASYQPRGRSQVEVMGAAALIDSPKHGRLRSHLLLWSGSGSIWKLRATYPADSASMSDAAIEQLGDLLVDWSRKSP